MLTPADVHPRRQVAFYFAFIQCYLMFLVFPALTGVTTWLFLPKYSLAYAIITSIWCSVFLEYWKIQEVDLSIRWNTRGVNKSKPNRPEFKFDRVVVDASGRIKHYFPKFKQISRQLLQIPFILFATIALGAIICCVFAVEILVSEAYEGPHQFYLVSHSPLSWLRDEKSNLPENPRRSTFQLFF